MQSIYLRRMVLCAVIIPLAGCSFDHRNTFNDKLACAHLGMKYETQFRTANTRKGLTSLSVQYGYNQKRNSCLASAGYAEPDGVGHWFVVDLATNETVLKYATSESDRARDEYLKKSRDLLGLEISPTGSRF